MKVAAYQMPVRYCYGADALERLRDRVQECEDAGVHLLCCPEGALGGLADYVDAPEDIALASDPKALAIRLRPLASRTVAVVVGFTERDEGGRYYNAAAVYAGGAVVGIYRKRHPAIRQSRYSAGAEAPVFTVNGMRIGILICRDSTDSRLAETLVQRGAHLLCIPTNNAMPPNRTGPQLVEEVRALDAHYAVHLVVSVIRADVVGEARGLASAGASMITWPNGASVRARGIGAGELIAGDLTADSKRDNGTNEMKRKSRNS
ncbi:MAG: carbon-nitrogen hydrolase family protein [Acidobacteria bacterium]|nr:carbon-nitrogen hydrolase family protein [Acidobacteriota bacterium]MCW5969067.1 carbon-nitrogen hydrolase family protein [Blastocatellales bacterium]